MTNAEQPKGRTNLMLLKNGLSISHVLYPVRGDEHISKLEIDSDRIDFTINIINKS